MTMERNPYAAPAAPVADPSVPEPADRPPEVTRAVLLIWISIGLGILGLFIAPREMPFGWVGIGIVALLTLAIWAWIITKIARGRNWARITYLVLIVLGYGSMAFTWQVQIATLKASPLSAVLTVVEAVIAVYAIYLLFSGPASAWFRRVTGAVR
jgi:hypothetical protein